MKTKRIKAFSSWITTVFLAWTVGYHTAFAQDAVGPTTPGAIPNPGTYQGSMEIQRQQDQQAQQFRDQQNTITDAAGRGQTAPLPAGRYYVFNPVHVSNKPMMWNLPVDLKAGTNTLTLDQHNLTLVQ